MTAPSGARTASILSDLRAAASHGPRPSTTRTLELGLNKSKQPALADTSDLHLAGVGVDSNGTRGSVVEVIAMYGEDRREDTLRSQRSLEGVNREGGSSLKG